MNATEEVSVIIFVLLEIICFFQVVFLVHSVFDGLSYIYLVVYKCRILGSFYTFIYYFLVVTGVGAMCCRYGCQTYWTPVARKGGSRRQV